LGSLLVAIGGEELSLENSYPQVQRVAVEPLPWLLPRPPTNSGIDQTLEIVDEDLVTEFDELGARIVTVLGEPAARELLTS
jgi:hypothetical protein